MGKFEEVELYSIRAKGVLITHIKISHHLRNEMRKPTSKPSCGEMRFKLFKTPLCLKFYDKEEKTFCATIIAVKFKM